MLVRFIHQGRVREGYLDGEIIQLLDGPMLERGRPGQETVSLSAVTLVAPCEPSKVICIGLNYFDHAREMNMDLPEEPLLFMKPSTSVIGHGENIVAVPHSERFDYEGELAVVIGQRTKNISEQQAESHIFGYTCANDFTARDLQLADKQWTRGKSFDTFCPIGPGIVETVAPDAGIRLTVDGETRQQSSLDQLIFNVRTAVSYISHQMTLLPGDVILTGTPPGVGPVSVGQSMSVSIDGIGELTNRLVAPE